MSTADTIYGVRWHGPELLERGRDNVVTCPLDRSGETPTVSAASVTLKRGTVTLGTWTADSLSPPTATIPTSLLATLQHGFGYQVVWSCTIGGQARTFDRPAVICRRALFPVVVQADLVQLHPQIGSASLLPQGTTLQQWIDAAWEEIVGRLTAEGTLPDIIVEPYALRPLHRYLALHLLFTSWGTSLNAGSTGNRWSELAESYAGKYRDAWSKVAWLTDTNRDGAPDSKTRRRAGRPQIFTVEMRPGAAAGNGSGWDF